MGTTISRQDQEFIAQVIRYLPVNRMTGEKKQWYIEKDGDLRAVLEQAFLAELETEKPAPAPARRTIGVIERRIRLTLDYSVAPIVALRATGCDHIDQRMLEICPVSWKRSHTAEVEVCVIDMGRAYQSDEAKLAISELGLVVPPDNMALWTLSKVHPYLQREIGIMDPGTVWQGEDGAPCFAYLDGPASGIAQRVWVTTQTGWVRAYRVIGLKVLSY